MYKRQIQGYETQLNKTEAEINKTTNSINKFNKEIKDNGGAIAVSYTHLFTNDCKAMYMIL